MNIKCSVCGSYSAENKKLVKSLCMPGARYVSCEACRDAKSEPRPLVVLGVRYGNEKKSRQHIKYHRYMGPEITASEIIE